MLVPGVTRLLIAHSRAEEAEVYPVARDEAGKTEGIAHSQEEHAQAEQILARLKATDHNSSEFDALLTQLIDAVTHHVEEEESKVLPGMRDRMDESRRSELADAFIASRAKHLADEPGKATKESCCSRRATPALRERRR
jgi:hemerythrin superfamily protein